MPSAWHLPIMPRATKSSHATYQQTALTAFQQLEDNLAALRILAIQLQQLEDAVALSQRPLNIASDRYYLGLDPYLDVITAQTSILSHQQAAVTLRMQQLTDTVQLIEAPGAGWNASQLPSQQGIAHATPTRNP